LHLRVSCSRAGCLLEREILYTLREAHVLIERWRQLYNNGRPHSALGYPPPASATRAVPTLTPLACAALALGAGLNYHHRWTPH